MKKTLLYVNLGTPEEPTVKKVGEYLHEFLMDPLVLDLPFLLRFLLVYFFIVPFRKKKSANAYKQIWTAQGSPLLMNSRALQLQLKAQLGEEWRVELAMRYGEPSIMSIMQKLKADGIQEIHLLTAYPQYAQSSAESVFIEVRRSLKELNYPVKIKYIPHYETHPGFIQAFAQNIQNEIQNFKPDALLLSFHGLPIRHVKNISRDCQGQGACSLSDNSTNALCYRRQSFKTAAALNALIQWPKNIFHVGFQSRLTEGWIQPFSDMYYRTLPQKGVKRLLVACPSFTADCLETLEEVAIRGRDQFIRAGGQDLKLVPCLNADSRWVKAIDEMIRDENLWRWL